MPFFSSVLWLWLPQISPPGSASKPAWLPHHIHGQELPSTPPSLSTLHYYHQNASNTLQTVAVDPHPAVQPEKVSTSTFRHPPLTGGDLATRKGEPPGRAAWHPDHHLHQTITPYSSDSVRSHLLPLLRSRRRLFIQVQAESLCGC